MQKIKCVVFDVGGVLTTENIRTVWSNLNTKIGRKVFGKTSAGGKFVKGKISGKEYYGYMSKKCGISGPKLADMMKTEYSRTVLPNRRTLAIAKKLRAGGYSTGIISNISADHKAINKKRHIYDGFRPVVLSCDAGCKKPEAIIYRAFVRKSGFEPRQCVFIDDVKENLSTPRKLGMKTIYFRNKRQLITDLRRMGVGI